MGAASRIGLPLLLAAACARQVAEPPPPPLPPILATETVLSLLEDPARLSGGGAGGAPIEIVDLRIPRLGGDGTGGATLGFIAPTPVTAHLAAPERPDDTWFSFAVSIEEGFYGVKSSVAFTVEVDGAPVWTRSLDAVAVGGADADAAWTKDRVRLPPGERITLRAEYSGKANKKPRVRFGLLEFERDRELPRRQARAEGASVVLVLIDTLRADGLACLGNPRPASPVLDALAARGAVFERAYSPAPWTVPSTASLLTALAPPAHGSGFAGSNFLAHRLLTLAEAFARNGFSTAAFSNNNLISAERNFGQGFESFTMNPWETAGRTMARAEEWLAAHADERFFLYLHLIDPHSPYNPPAEHRARFAADVPADLDAKPQATVSKILAGRAPPAEQLALYAEQCRRLYDGETSFADEQVGRLLAQLRALGLEEDTVIAVTSDHGEEFLEHGLMGHVHHLHHELVHVPLIVAGPGVAAGRRVARPAEIRLLGPTLMKLARTEDRAGFADEDLLDDARWLGREGEPLFFSTGPGRLPTTPGAAWQHERRLYGVRRGDWFYVWAPSTPKLGAAREFLYHVASDPGELDDRAAAQPALCLELRGLIQDWLDRSLSGPIHEAVDARDRADMRALGYVDD